MLGSNESDTVVIEGAFNDDETRTLNLFLDEYEKLVDSQVMRDGIPCEITIKMKDGKAEVETDLPTQDQLDILVQRLRLFVLKKERVSFVNVCAILRKHLEDLRLTELLKWLFAAFHNHPAELGSTLIINEALIDREATLIDWLNGYQYHLDDDRRQRLRKRGVNVESPAIRRNLVNLLLNKQTAVINLAALVAVLMKRSSCFDIYDATLRQAEP